MEKFLYLSEGSYETSKPEKYTIRIPTKKDQLIKTVHYPRTIMSFNEGILENIPNSFKVLINLSGLPQSVIVQYNAEELLKSGIVYIGMHTCFYTDEMPHQAIEMLLSSEPRREGRDLMVAEGFNSMNFPDTLTELRIKITVAKAKRSELDVIKLDALVPKQTDMDFGKYFLSPTLSDVLIKCKGEEFPAHILILSANSPVFEAMFSNHLKESEEKKVEIEDADANVLRELLRFCYTARVQNLETTAVKLYKLGHFYMMANLKTVCEDSILEQVNLDTVVELYSLARTYGSKRILDATSKFISKNKKTVFKSGEEFKGLIEAVSPEYLYEIIQLSISK